MTELECVWVEMWTLNAGAGDGDDDDDKACNFKNFKN